MGEQIKIAVDDQEFRFRALPDREEQILIRSEMANMLKRGYDELLDIEDAIQKSYQRHVDFNIEQYGKEKFEEMNKRYFELFRLRREARQNTVGQAAEEEVQKLDAEQDEISKKINNNRHFIRFIDFTNTKDFLEDYATMRVTCVYPKDFNWKGMDKEQEMKIIQEYNQKKNLARLSRNLKS